MHLISNVLIPIPGTIIVGISFLLFHGHRHSLKKLCVFESNCIVDLYISFCIRKNNLSAECSITAVKCRFKKKKQCLQQG